MSGWNDPSLDRPEWSDPWGDGRDQEASRDFKRARSVGARIGGTLVAAAVGAIIAVNVLRSLPPLPTFDGIVFPSAAVGASDNPQSSAAALLPSTPPELLAPAVAPAMGLVTTWSEDATYILSLIHI